MNAKLPLALLIAATLAAPVLAGSHQAVPRSGGGGPRMSAPSRGGGSGSRPAPHQGGAAARSAPGGHAGAARGTAGGVARYGHGGYGYGYGYGGGYYPYYGYGGGWWYPWWGVGWYGGCWDCYWPGYGYGYGYGYAPYRMYDEGGYDEAAASSRRSEPAVIETKISPSSATVLVDGEDVGFASDYNGRWDRLRVSPGKHAIAFREKGYRSLTIEIEAQPGASYVMSDALTEGEGEDSRTLATHTAPAPAPAQNLEPSPLARPAATGRLRIHAEPADAAIYLDGEYLGLGGELARIHGALAVPVGSHRLEAARPGFSSAVQTIEVGESDLAVVELKLDAQH